jgi:hypothetical protein
MALGGSATGSNSKNSSVFKASSSIDHQSMDSNPLFEKIRTTLQRTEPDKWRRSGEDFNAHAKNPKAVQVWETVFILSIKEGLLVLRCSIPLRSEYFGGGYTLIPTADPLYTVEVREKGWNARELTDPFYSNSQKKHLKVQRLLEGKMAKVLYFQVKELIESFNSEKRTSFEKDCFELTDSLIEQINEMKFDAWKKDDSEANITRYHSIIGQMSVDVAQVTHGERTSYHLKLGRDGMFKSMNSTQVEDIFNAIEELGRNASLEQLSSLLDSIDLL